VTVEVKATILR